MASLERLLGTNCKLLDIALEYGFEYEQSYLRSFKREFGVTPGKFRKMNNLTTKRRGNNADKTKAI
jgi:AraC family transcriptional regulator